MANDSHGKFCGFCKRFVRKGDVDVHMARCQRKAEKRLKRVPSRSLSELHEALAVERRRAENQYILKHGLPKGPGDWDRLNRAVEADQQVLALLDELKRWHDARWSLGRG